MLEKYIVSILVILLFHSCSSSTKTNDLESERINGKVAALVEFKFEALNKFGEITKGDVIKKLNEPNRVLTFNKSGNKIEELSLNGFQPILRKNYFYDNEDRINFIDYLENNGELYQRIKYRYDTNGVIILNYYNEQGDNLFKQSNYYDENERIIKSVFHISDPIFTTYQYLDQNIKIVTQMTEDSTIIRTEKLYHNRVIQSTNQQNDTTKYEYNDKGYIFKEYFDQELDTVLFYSYEYEYDDHDNWTIRRKILKTYDAEVNTPISITYREIKYHDGNLNLPSTADSILKQSSVYQENEKQQIENRIATYCNESMVKLLFENENVISDTRFKLKKGSTRVTEIEDCKYQIVCIFQSKEYSSIQQQVVYTFYYYDDYKSYRIEPI